MSINSIINRNKKNKNFPEFFQVDNKEITNKMEIANEFNEYFWRGLF